MANGFGSLGSAYATLGAAAGKDFERKRKEEEDYYRTLRRQQRQSQIFNFLASPLLKSAGEALTEGVSSLITGNSEEKYLEFLNSEEVRNGKRKQRADFRNAQRTIKEHEEALAYSRGSEAYYADKEYKESLADFYSAYDKKEFGEGAEILLRKDAGEKANKNMSKREAAYENALLVQDPKEYAKIYEMAKPKKGDTIKKIFGGTDPRSVREAQLNALVEKSKITRESLNEARKSLGYNRTAAETADLAERLDSFRYKKEDWNQTNSETVYKPISSGGKSFTVEYKEVTFNHPEKNQSEKKLVPTDENSKKFLEKGLLGTIQEVVTTTDALGRKIKTIQTSEYTRDGVKIITSKTSKVEPLDSTLMAEAMTGNQSKVAESSFFDVVSSFNVADGETAKTVTAYLETTEGSEGLLPPKVFGLSRNLATSSESLGVGLTLKESYTLSSAMLLRGINSERTAQTKFKFFEAAPTFDKTKNNGLGLNIDLTSEKDEKQRSTLALHFLDAFYFLEESKSSNVGISKAEESVLLKNSYEDFIKLDRRSREVMLNTMPTMFKNKKYPNEDYTMYRLFNAANDGLND